MNQTAIDFIRDHEGCRLTAYQDQGGVWTIGYGHTGKDVVAGLLWTQEKADAVFLEDLAEIEKDTLAIVGGKFSEKAMAAFISFVYNLGPKALQSSHLLQCTKDGDYLGAAKAFLNWDHIGSKEVKGLLIRRLEEAALFLRGV